MVSTVVLPKPAGAETSVNVDARPAVQPLAQSSARYDTTSKPQDIQLRLKALLRDPAAEMYGLELSEETGLQPGTAYPILLRLEHEGWVASRWEDIDPRAEKRPARRYYRLTAGGAVQSSAALAGARRPKSTALRRLAEGGGTA
jgi:DNA-binding PadR family transcriptional regulator